MTLLFLWWKQVRSSVWRIYYCSSLFRENQTGDKWLHDLLIILLQVSGNHDHYQISSTVEILFLLFFAWQFFFSLTVWLRVNCVDCVFFFFWLLHKFWWGLNATISATILLIADIKTAVGFLWLSDTFYSAKCYKCLEFPALGTLDLVDCILTGATESLYSLSH